jgi:7-keto-8-aminopelargonate synthetase-like enzyme
MQNATVLTNQAVTYGQHCEGSRIEHLLPLPPLLRYSNQPLQNNRHLPRTRDLQPTGATRRCLNLGSYNYLGFAASDPYCTPRVIEAVRDWGVSHCSPRGEGGGSPLHVELERRVAEFVGAEGAVCFGMGFATNSATIPLLCGAFEFGFESGRGWGLGCIA